MRVVKKKIVNVNATLFPPDFAPPRHSVKKPATVTITGYLDESMTKQLSRGQVMIETSRDPAPCVMRFELRGLRKVVQESEIGIRIVAGHSVLALSLPGAQNAISAMPTVI
jgi:hypothetical protein